MNVSTFAYLLTLLFVYLQLTHQIDWSLWAVISPVWGLWLAQFLVGMVLGYQAARKGGQPYTAKYPSFKEHLVRQGVAAKRHGNTTH